MEQFEPKGTLSPLVDINLDLDEVKAITNKEIERLRLAFELHKVVAILQKVELAELEKEQQKQLWNVLCFFSSFKILRLYIDCFNGKILKSEQLNIFDFVQIK